MINKKVHPSYLFVLLFSLLGFVGWIGFQQSTPVLANQTALKPLQNIVQVAAGFQHTCALTTEGAVKCWGWNDYGQLGNGTDGNQGIPVVVSGLSSGVVAIAAGQGHTCALTTVGSVKCWGWNDYGQLGDGTTGSKLTPVSVEGLSSGVVAITAGENHTCAITIGNIAKCWGKNSDGQLGDNTTEDRYTPTIVSGLANHTTAITAGSYHTCALVTVAAIVKCWGANYNGQLGNGSDIDNSTPTDVVELSHGVTGLAAGESHTCALTAEGGVKCWGWNWSGQLGIGTTDVKRNTPVDVMGLSSGVTTITANGNHTCASNTAGEAKCWGLNGFGQLGDSTTTQRNIPVDVIGLVSNIKTLVAGSYHTCAVAAEGRVQCWGWNSAGQLGDGTYEGRYTPTAVHGLSSGLVAIAAGHDSHTCALTTSGGVQCWGWNGNGQLGIGSFEASSTPVAVLGLSSGVAALAVGDDHTCVLNTEGAVHCWGRNNYGQLGDSTTSNRNTPAVVNGLNSDVTAITAGDDHTCALTRLGSVYCWGANDYGQLGDGSFLNKNTPIDVLLVGTGIATIAAGKEHTCAVTTSGSVRCWGRNDYGQLGDTTTTNRNIAVVVEGLENNIANVVAAGFHSCVLTTKGGVQCWGDNRGGQLGDGTVNSKNTPVTVSGLGNSVASITAGTAHTCVLTKNGEALCWGYNASGELGDGTADQRNIPVTISGLDSSLAIVDAGNSYTCAVTTVGGARCWGYNAYNQLGDGSAWRTTPVDVTEEDGTTVTPTATPTATSTPVTTPSPVTARVEGVVLDQETQKGIPNVLMTLLGSNNLNRITSAQLTNGRVYTTTTDLNGAYVFSAVELGTYTLTGTKAGLVIEAPAPLVISTSGAVKVTPLQATKAEFTIYLPMITGPKGQ